MSRKSKTNSTVTRLGPTQGSGRHAYQSAARRPLYVLNYPLGHRKDLSKEEWYGEGVLTEMDPLGSTNPVSDCKGQRDTMVDRWFPVHLKAAGESNSSCKITDVESIMANAQQVAALQVFLNTIQPMG